MLQLLCPVHLSFHIPLIHILAQTIYSLPCLFSLAKQIIYNIYYKKWLTSKIRIKTFLKLRPPRSSGRTKDTFIMQLYIYNTIFKSYHMIWYCNGISKDKE